MKEAPSAKKPRGARTRRPVPAPSAPVSTLTLESAFGLQVGDRVTIGGNPQEYRVTAVGDGPTLTLAPVVETGLFWPALWWLLGALGVSGGLVWAVMR